MASPNGTPLTSTSTHRGAVEQPGTHGRHADRRGADQPVRLSMGRTNHPIGAQLHGRPAQPARQRSARVLDPRLDAVDHDDQPGAVRPELRGAVAQDVVQPARQSPDQHRGLRDERPGQPPAGPPAPVDQRARAGAASGCRSPAAPPPASGGRRPAPPGGRRRPTAPRPSSAGRAAARPGSARGRAAPARPGSCRAGRPASPDSTAASFQASWCTSRSPSPSPCPTNGGVRCAASPASSTRPARHRSATCARNVYSAARTISRPPGSTGASSPASRSGAVSVGRGLPRRQPELPAVPVAGHVQEGRRPAPDRRPGAPRPTSAAVRPPARRAPATGRPARGRASTPRSATRTVLPAPSQPSTKPARTDRSTPPARTVSVTPSASWTSPVTSAPRVSVTPGVRRGRSGQHRLQVGLVQQHALRPAVRARRRAAGRTRPAPGGRRPAGGARPSAGCTAATSSATPAACSTRNTSSSRCTARGRG